MKKAIVWGTFLLCMVSLHVMPAVTTQFDVPILFLIFNRPDKQEKVFEKIRAMRPKYLFIAADGPRKDRPNDRALCAQARSIVKKVTWPCTVRTLFREKNLGCGLGVSRAISWFFHRVPEGIILEDDCVPTRSFFEFCKKMLMYYRHDTRIFHISGRNPWGRQLTYFFARCPHVWGWATWARAWRYYDYKAKTLDEFEAKRLYEAYYPGNENYGKNRLEYFKGGRNADTWDWQWAYTVLAQYGLSIHPPVNMITNIGVDGSATHKKDPGGKQAKFAALPAYEYDCTTLTHPNFVIPKFISESFKK